MRWLGIDLGERRIGLALSDPLELTGQALAMILRKGSRAADLDAVATVVRTHEVEGIVMGLPRHMNGTEGEMAEKVRSFGSELERLTGAPVVYWDERLSTVAAQRILIEADVSRGKRKGKVDQLAAAIILQNFLDSRRPGN